MSEDLTINPTGTKKEQYQSLIPQIHALVAGEPDIIANMANICAALKQQFNFLWIGFYLVRGEELVLGPFQGPVACTRIAKGKGVCGTAWEEKRAVIVPDVNAFQGHIACSSLSKSEIVIPVIYNEEVIAVLDADSEHLNNFDKTDEQNMIEIVNAVLTSFNYQNG